MAQSINFEKEMSFLSLAEKLKMEMRHCWMSSGRQESVAEHSWRLALMALRYADKLDQKVDLSKCLQIALVHDFAEAVTGDIAAFKQDPKAKILKAKAELEAMQGVRAHYDDAMTAMMFDTWMEYESQDTYESKYIKALDKLEAFIAHNESPLETWEYVEKEMLFEEKYLTKHCSFDSFLRVFAEEVILVGIKKLEVAGEDIAAIRKSAAAKYDL